ncbi:TIGR00725 family protein [Chondromyces apiculatus]|uniref:TIGR00725 family protein n=1 Tax=Chondromyces apiculatus DSM 436 TaxID=1192034 RepID=A0A017T6T9_9BACT|nr:TIGR00725 family protein [Chondromyces apiculatus]EYF04939.1 Hypothetical protein CAP_3750 [Chondromyces apiculatus DSM 436]
MRRPLAAVIGSTRATPDQLTIAHELGAALVEVGFRVLTGGLGGVMDAAFKGARSSGRYQSGDTVAILPSYLAEQASEAADVAICTGMNHARNTILIASASVVLAIGGRSGTLGEIALAWELGRPIICVGNSEGWATRLSGESLDDRRTDLLHGPLAPRPAAHLAWSLAASAPAPPSFT